MKLKSAVFVVTAILLLSFTIEAQKLKVTSGKLKSLSDHKSFNMVYTYEDGLKIGKKTEAVYTAEKVADKNEDEAGSGDAWLVKWEENKQGGKFFDKFETLFNEVLESKGVSGSRDNSSATCTLTIDVYYMDPGYNVGISRRPAYVSMTATFTADGNELAVVNMVKAPGSGAGGYDFDAAYRISEGFEKSGKTLAKSLAKGAYK